jgi:hypothetical protein
LDRHPRSPPCPSLYVLRLDGSAIHDCTSVRQFCPLETSAITGRRTPMRDRRSLARNLRGPAEESSLSPTRQFATLVSHATSALPREV